ncbi:Cadmium, cobalt and zinc/H(+)-K(+) antiporter [Thalassoglobus neptunius]|uniref:Cadmium, cobalt and zinc/H(+)-K(+) antiporter n=1 Tax=Thalassoglobus neptunius TaxID=1938619 RepID=A0A5C5WM27_9PLAN|nr:cation diffusion facilitator family transporter [Thalassoglobus neptunius]TWT51718.1 Cadmium, cobalt and zinc/H(+)-K(+) antiporter [Thalassoglobus neptunius]
MTDCGCELEAENDEQRKTLRVVLAINAAMFLIEVVTGILAGSTGLIADSLDMLADASVYAISLFAVGRTVGIRRKAATISGALQLALGIGVLVESYRRFVGGGEPIGVAMIGMGSVALIANTICLKLISKHKGGDVNFRASYIFSANDVIANIGVIISGLLVLWLGSQIPDLSIGVIIAMIVVWGGVRILKDARNERE